VSNRIIWTASRVEAMLAEKNDLRARVAELEADLTSEKQRNADHIARCLEATGVDVGAGGMTLIEAIEVLRSRIAELEADAALATQTIIVLREMLERGEEVGDHD